MATDSSDDIQPVGFSGATIRRDGTRIIKIGSPRLEQAAAKQEWLRKHIRGACVPRVFDVEMVGGRCQVTMEYVDAIRLENHLRDPLDHAFARDLGKRLAELATEIAAESVTPGKTTEGEMLSQKLQSVRLHLTSLYPRSSQAALQEFFVACSAFEPPATELLPTPCHGDLAFDNILIDLEGKLWLLDCLDQPFDNYYWDVAKILQSSHVDWPAIRRGEIRRSLMYSRDPWLSTIANSFLAAMHISWHEDPRVPLYLGICLARIIPYAPTWPQQRALLELVTTQLGYYRRRKKHE